MAQSKITKKKAAERLPNSEWIATWYKNKAGCWLSRKDKRTVLFKEIARATEFFEPEISFPKNSKYPDYATGNLFQFIDKKNGAHIIVSKDPVYDAMRIGFLTKQPIQCLRDLLNWS